MLRPGVSFPDGVELLAGEGGPTGVPGRDRATGAERPVRRQRRDGRPFGFRFDEVDVDVPTAIDDILAPDHPVLAGVTEIGFFNGCTARLTGSNPQARGLMALAGEPDSLVVGAAEAGAGRVVFLTDSAIGSDGSDSHGNRLRDHDAWNDPAQDNGALLVNAIAWLGQK